MAFAAKVMNTVKYTVAEKEIKVLENLRNLPNIVGYYGCDSEVKDEKIIILQLCGGDVQQV